jgi:hypothetical protein
MELDHGYTHSSKLTRPSLHPETGHEYVVDVPPGTESPRSAFSAITAPTRRNWSHAISRLLRSKRGHMKKQLKNTASELKLANSLWGPLSEPNAASLSQLLENFCLRVSLGDILCLDGRWYVTHAGLIRLARRSRCHGIRVQPAREFCDPSVQRWAFRATVYKSRTCRGFVGYGDADPSNVSYLVHGAEMRVAETRAVNRALRKAYGIGICSVEEIGSAAVPPAPRPEPKKLPQPANGNGNCGGRTVRDRLCQLIRQHQLDATLVKSYATDFCGVKTLREATREQVEAFVAHLSDWAEKDRDALHCQLNSYLGQKEGVA